jgi:hypothetical protein
MAQGVEHLPHKCEALSSNPTTAKKKKGWKEGREGGREIVLELRINYKFILQIIGQALKNIQKSIIGML